MSKSWLSLEAVQKFACKVCLKMWDLDYNTMLQLLNLPPLSVRREYLKLTAMYNILNGYSYYPSGIFVQSNNRYYSSQSTNVNFVRPYARTNYLYYSFVPNVVHAWNNLPYFIKTSPCISTFKSSLLYHFYQAHVS